MRLYEHEAKALLAAAGVPVPAGALWPVRVAARRLVLKAQVLRGGRGKAGAVRVVEGTVALQQQAEELLQLRVQEEPVAAVLAEEWLPIARELYLALYLDRATACPNYLVSGRGGIDVEFGGEFTRVPVNPLIGLHSHHVRTVLAALGLAGAGAEAVVRGVWQAFTSNACSLLEINPLALCQDDRLVAADAKMEIDSRVAGRFPQYTGNREAQTPYEQAGARHNTVGVESDGDVVIVGSGAGVLMATADMVQARGGRLGGILDLGGFPRTPEQSAAVLALTHQLTPRVVFFNFYTQVARCDDFARAILTAFTPPTRSRLVVRFKGNGAEAGAELLAAAGVRVTDSLARACDWAVEGRH